MLFTYLSADVLCLAYPLAFVDSTCILSTSPTTEVHFKQYEERGFMVYRSQLDYATPATGKCLPHGFCAWAVCSFPDDHCMFMRFASVHDPLISGRALTAVWNWGGQPCENKFCCAVVARSVNLALAESDVSPI